MQKLFQSMLLVIIFSLIIPSSYLFASNSPIQILVNGQKILMNEAPVKESNTTLVQFRPIFEALGLIIKWNQKTKTIIGTKEGLEIQLTIDSKTAKVNGQTKTLSIAPRTIKGNTFVPIRFIGESTGATVLWDDKSNTISVNLGKYIATVKFYDGTYTGEVINDQAYGTGTYTYNDGRVISGDNWSLGSLNGNGKLTAPNGVTYEGQFKDTNFNGLGKLTMANGNVYTGEFKNGIAEGQGTYVFVNGTKYVGSFKNNNPDGYGVIYDSSGSIIEQGTYKNGELVSSSTLGQDPYTPPQTTTTTPTGNTTELIKQENLRHSQVLNQLKSDHDKAISFIEDKITEIRRSSIVGYYSESEFNQKRDSLQAKAQQIQNKINLLAMDNSLEAQYQLKDLNKQLADVNLEIKNLQDGRSAQLQIQNLQDMENKENRDYQSKVQAENALHQSNLASI